MTVEVAARRNFLESYFQKYADVPREVIVKEDILREGVSFTAAGLEAGRDAQPKTYHLFTFDRVTPEEMKQQEAVKAPELIYVYGGLYELRPSTMIRVRINPSSPYIIDVVDGKQVVCDSAGPIAEIEKPAPMPKYYDKKLSDGTPCSDIVQLLWGLRGYPRVIVMLLCQHWGAKRECKYCDINENVRLRRERGVLTMRQQYLKVDQVAEAVREIIMGEDWAPSKRDEQWEEGKRPPFCYVSGGSILKKFQGKDEEHFYREYVEAIRHCCGEDWLVDVDLQTAPFDKAMAKRFYDAGVRAHRPNYEVWDERLFNIICPGKAVSTGRDTWLRNAVEEVETFGPGNVYPGFVAGVEMCQPWGFKEIKDAIQSNREAFEFMMSHGAVPRPIQWLPEPLSALRGQEPPPVDYYIQLDMLWYEIWKKYKVPPPPSGEYYMGPGRARNPNSAFGDMGT